MTRRVREPVVADAAAIARVHVRAWQAAYRGGLMPDEYLTSLSTEERAVMWTRVLERPLGPRRKRFVIEDDTGSVIGFIVVGPAGDDDAATEGELFAINVDPGAWGTGAGAALHNAGMDELRQAGFGRAVLWVHPKNARARSFYESREWHSEGIERRVEVMGVQVLEISYSISLIESMADGETRPTAGLPPGNE